MAKLKRLILPAVLALALYWAFFGGTYSVFEVRGARRARDAEVTERVRLEAEAASLSAWADSLETDSLVLERLARERFGLIRDGEVLYRFAEPGDSTAPLEADSVTEAADR